jgi:hypothetical protein
LDSPSPTPQIVFDLPGFCREGLFRIALDRGSKPTWVCSRRGVDPYGFATTDRAPRDPPSDTDPGDGDEMKVPSASLTILDHLAALV